jgi:hypothetical protein
MAESITVTERIVVGGTSIGPSLAIPEGLLVGCDVTISASAADEQIIIPIDISQVKLLFILSELDLTLETNNGTTPDDTIAIKAGVPYLWREDKVDSLILTADVDAIFVTNGVAATSRLQIYAILDNTP